MQNLHEWDGSCWVEPDMSITLCSNRSQPSLESRDTRLYEPAQSPLTGPFSGAWKLAVTHG